MATAGNPLADDIETNIDGPGIDPLPEPGTSFPGERGKREPVEEPGAEDEDQDELDREDEAVDEEDPL
jgi:hypothetical protein